MGTPLRAVLGEISVVIMPLRIIAEALMSIPCRRACPTALSTALRRLISRIRQWENSIFTHKRGMVIASRAPFFAEEIEDDLHLALEGIAIHRGVWGTLASRELSSMPVSNPLTR
jgi:hypothetical protein